MNNIDIFSILPVLIVALVLFIGLVVILRLIFVNVGAREIAIKERRYLGRRMPPGRVVATEGEVGIQAEVLKPGLHLIRFPFEKVVRKVPLIEIGADELGIVEAIDGEPMLPGRIFALDRAQNAHLSFQNAELFVSAGGQRGPQVDILTPGTYRILNQSLPFEGGTDVKPGLFTIRLYDATVIDENQIGLVEALDGATLNPGDYVAESIEGHDNFQDGHEFIDSKGQRGPQKDILLPGTYYINPLLFKVIPESAKEVKPGEVAVIVSNTGKDPSDEIRRQMAAKVRQRMEREEKEQAAQSAAHLDRADAEAIKSELLTGDPADRRLDEGAHEAYVVPEGYRGIQETVVGPGRYYVNTLAITPIIIPTTNQTVEWTSGEVVNTFNPFEVISKDGFTMQLEVRVVFRVKPEDAPFMVAKIGGIERLIQNVMHPLIDSIFRNQASESSAMAYLQNRHEEQERAEARVRAHLLKYHVDVVNVLICHIHLPEELMKTQTEKVLAEQRLSMFDAQREAEERRIQLEKTTAQADNQKDLMGATVGVEIAGKRAEQRKAEGEGEAHYIQQTGRAEAEKVRLMGEAQGVAYHEQVNALGAQGVALVEVLKVIGEKGVRITPDIMASGGSGGDGAGGGIGTVLLLNLFRDRLHLPGANGEKAPGT